MHFKVVVVGEDPEKQLLKFQYFEDENENLDAHFDWCKLGGRWSDSLLLKNGKYVNQSEKKDIDFNGMENFYAYAIVKDGTWEESDAVALSDESKWDQKVIDLYHSLGDKEQISIYDCHF